MNIPSIYLNTPKNVYYIRRKDCAKREEKKESILYLPNTDSDKLREAERAYAGVDVGGTTFGYNCRLKSLYKRGKIKIKYSFYGGKLDPKKVSIEHIIPHSKGGINSQKNYVLCNTDQNFVRGNNPIETYLDWTSVGLYLDQFKGVKIAGFDGDQYIKDIMNSLNRALKAGL